MIVGNFTPDTIEWIHQGMMGEIKPGDVTEFNDGRAKHILNKWGQRGLVQFKLDDNMEVKQAESLKIYKRFWTNQLIGFNQHNEARKNESKAYVFPTEQVADKAKEFGIELITPWMQQKSTDSKQLQDLKEENLALKNDMKTMAGSMSEMLAMMKELKSKPAIPIIVDTEKLIKRFRTLQKDVFKPWVEENLTQLLEGPQEVLQEAQKKWFTFYKEPWPGSETIAD